MRVFFAMDSELCLTNVCGGGCRSAVLNWTRHEVELQAAETSGNAKLQFITNSKTTIWFDQVSLMPTETFKVYFPCFIHFIKCLTKAMNLLLNLEVVFRAMAFETRLLR